jgi:hypothetical protein
MDRVNICYLGSAYDSRDIQITLGGGIAPDTDGLIRVTHVEGFAVGHGVHRYRLDPHLLTGPDDPAGDLAAVSDEQFFDRALCHKKLATKFTAYTKSLIPKIRGIREIRG